MINKIKQFIRNIELTFHEHEWQFQGILPMIERSEPDISQVYEIKCIHCHKKQRRNYFGFMRLYNTGRVKGGDL